MRWFKVGLLAAPFAALTLAFLSAGCGGQGASDDEPYKPKRRGGGGAVGAPQEDLRKPVAAEAKQYTNITGKVTFEGALPDLNQLSQLFLGGMSAHDFCRSGNAASPIRPLEKEQQDYRVGKGNTLGNVFVWIEPLSKDQYFPVAEEQLAEFKGKTVNISQPHCVFLPHCTTVFLRYYDGKGMASTGQKLIVENDAFVAHNAKVGNNDLGLISARSKPEDKGIELDVKLAPQDMPVIISCNVHTWMKGYILSRDHPYTAVSSVGADLPKKVYENPDAPNFGQYLIKGAPVGAKVKLKAWHEKAGWLTGPAGREITITKDMAPIDLVAKIQ